MLRPCHVTLEPDGRGGHEVAALDRAGELVPILVLEVGEPVVDEGGLVAELHAAGLTGVVPPILVYGFLV